MVLNFQKLLFYLKINVLKLFVKNSWKNTPPRICKIHVTCNACCLKTNPTEFSYTLVTSMWKNYSFFILVFFLRKKTIVFFFSKFLLFYGKKKTLVFFLTKKTKIKKTIVFFQEKKTKIWRRKKLRKKL